MLLAAVQPLVCVCASALLYTLWQMIMMIIQYIGERRAVIFGIKTTTTYKNANRPIKKEKEKRNEKS